MTPSAAVGDFRHVEIQKIGKKERFLQPPGAKTNGIFGFSPARVRLNAKDHNRSDTGSNSSSCSSLLSSPLSSSSSSASLNNFKTTKYRLFGPPDVTDVPRRKVQEWMKSSLFSPPESPTAIARCQSARNPITGENCISYDLRRKECRSAPRRVTNPITGEGVYVKNVANTRKVPPGGKTTLILYYPQ